MYTPNQATMQFMHAHADDDVQRLALQRNKFADVDFDYAIAQIDGRQRAAGKLPHWAACPDVVFPTRLSLEQCSSEATASYKASIMQQWFGLGKGEQLGLGADLTGGFGVDTAFLADIASRFVYVEQNADLAAIAELNFRALGYNNVDVRVADCTTVALPHCDFLFIDPARRDNLARKTLLLQDCTPNILAIKDQLFATANVLLIKLSPLFDWKELLRVLPEVQQVHIVALRGECKELLAIAQKGSIATEQVPVICANLLPNGNQLFCFSTEAEMQATPLMATEIETFLYEPNAAVMNAGAFRSVATAFGVKKLHRHTHLYTSTMPVEGFAGRAFRVLHTYTFSKTDLKQVAALEQANVVVRNFPMSTAELRRKLKLREGGTRYLFACTLAPEKHLLILCERV